MILRIQIQTKDIRYKELTKFLHERDIRYNKIYEPGESQNDN